MYIVCRFGQLVVSRVLWGLWPSPAPDFGFRQFVAFTAVALLG